MLESAAARADAEPMRLYDAARLPKDRIGWTANLLMLPVVLMLFVALRLAAPGLAMPLSALLAAVVGVGTLRGVVLVARARAH